jgi:hypothetical protein
MNTYRLKNVFRNLIVGWVMVTLLLSTVVSVQVSPSQAASTDRANEATPVTASDASVDTGVVEGPGDASALPQGLPGPELVPLNTLIYIEAGRSAAVESAILDAGGYVYLQQDSALFVGVEDLDSDALEPLGARAVYNTEVPESVLAAMEEKDRSAAQVWNVIVREGPINVGAVANPNDESPSLLMKTPPQPLEVEPALLADLPDNDQTSVFMMGSVSVDVVFVESISGT